MSCSRSFGAVSTSISPATSSTEWSPSLRTLRPRSLLSPVSRLRTCNDRPPGRLRATSGGFGSLRRALTNLLRNLVIVPARHSSRHRPAVVAGLLTALLLAAGCTSGGRSGEGGRAASPAAAAPRGAGSGGGAEPAASPPAPPAPAAPLQLRLAATARVPAG